MITGNINERVQNSGYAIYFLIHTYMTTELMHHDHYLFLTKLVYHCNRKKSAAISLELCVWTLKCKNYYHQVWSNLHMGDNSKENIYRITDAISSTLQHNIRYLYPAITKYHTQPSLDSSRAYKPITHAPKTIKKKKTEGILKPQKFEEETTLHQYCPTIGRQQWQQRQEE